MSDIAAVAACTASEAPICGSLSDSCVLSLGRSTSTSPSQNVIRSRNHILRPVVRFSLPHPSARYDALTRARHRAFIAPRLIGSLAAFAAFPVYLAVRGAPTALEVTAF